MKKQTKTYLLLALVGTIWGMIAFKVFRGVSPDTVAVPHVQNVAFRPKNIKPKDTFSILANYRDPFLGTLPPKKVKKTSRTKKVQKAVPQVEIQYTGYITDKGTDQKIFFVTINGQQHLMHPKDKIQGVTLIGGTADRIRIRQNGKSRTIEIQQ